MQRILVLQLVCAAILLTLEIAAAGDYGDEKCYQEMAVGNCSEQIQRWYFDNRTGLCQPFTYTGCGGNGNNFNSTAYCYHACNVSQESGHSYSIEDTAQKLKPNVDDETTKPTDFSGQRPPHMYTTRQPTLIRNQPDSGSQPQRERRPVNDVSSDNQEKKSKRRRRRAVREPRRHQKTSSDMDEGYSTSSEDEYDSDPTHWRNVKAKRYNSGRPAPEHYPDDHHYGYSYYGNDGFDGDVGNSFQYRGRRRGIDLVTELLSQMQHTAALLERFVGTATTNRRVTPSRRRPTPKNAEEGGPPSAAAASKAEQTARNVTDFFRQRATTDGERRADGGSGRRAGKNSRRRGDRDRRRLLHVTLLGRLKRLPSGVSDRKPEISAAEKSQHGTSRQNVNARNDRKQTDAQMERHRQPETGPKVEDSSDDDNDDDLEVMSDRIRAIIADPDSSFTYDNISADDMLSLEEMMAQSSEFGTMKLVEKDADDDDDQEQAAVANTGQTSPATATVTGSADRSRTKNDQQAAEEGGASKSDSEPKAV